MKKDSVTVAVWERHKERERARKKVKRATAEYVAVERRTVAAYTASRRRFLEAVRTTCGCVDCGTREGTLHFDHRLGSEKEFHFRHVGYSWSRLIAEVEKCDVRCASCHPRRHARDRTHCGRGHEWTPENTYRWNNGIVECRICNNARQRARYHAKKSAA